VLILEHSTQAVSCHAALAVPKLDESALSGQRP